jgi:gas vesicle protein
MSEGDGGSSFACGLLTGAALGVMGALLLAPKSGAELRFGLAEGRRRLRETRERTLSELRESGHELHDAYDKALGALYDAVDDVKEAARAVVEAEEESTPGV